MREGKLEAGCNQMAAALKAADGDQRALVALVRCRLTGGKPAEALQVAENTWRRAQTSSVLRQLRAETKAAAGGKAAAQLSGDLPAILCVLAERQASTGQTKSASAEITTKLRARFPTQANFSDTAAWACYKSGDPVNAALILGDLVAKNPTVTDFRYHYGLALLAKGDNASAKRELTQAKNTTTSEALKRDVSQALLRAD